MTRRKAAAALLGAALITALTAAPALADHGRPWHWNRNYPTATAVAQAYFEDFSAANWPVYTAVLKWDNRPSYSRPYYRNAGTCDNSVVHCIPVYSQNLGRGDYAYTSWDKNLDGLNHIQHGSMTVTFNTYYAYTANQRESIACHELGHAAGPLKEGTHTDSCMYDGAQFPLNPSSHDFDLIVSNYDH